MDNKTIIKEFLEEMNIDWYKFTKISLILSIAFYILGFILGKSIIILLQGGSPFLFLLLIFFTAIFYTYVIIELTSKNLRG